LLCYRPAETAPAHDPDTAKGPRMNGAAVIAEILKREGTEFLSCYPR
jgi:hypothetical protein